MVKPPVTCKTKVIVAIPCFNTEQSIQDIVLGARKYVDKVLVINDGSADNTAKIAREAGALLINHSRNRGYGEAIKSCLKASITHRSDILVILDGDGQHDPDDIPKLITPILSKEADVVIGSRFKSNVVSMPSYRKFGIKLINLLFNIGSEIKVSDSQSGFRSFCSELVSGLSLTENGMSSSIEVLEKARQRGAVIKEVPIICHYSSSGFSFQAFWHGFIVALAVMKIRLKSLI